MADQDTPTREAVRGMIHANNEEQGRAWGAELDTLTDKVTAVEKKIVALVGDPDIEGSGMVPNLVDKFTTHMNLQTEWRNDDVRWRESTAQQMSEAKALAQKAVDEAASIRRHQEEMKKRMQLLSWLMMATKTVKIVGESLIDAADKGKKLYVAITAICSACVLAWTIYHSIVPALRVYLLHH
jgi:hypothetical protein